MGLGLPSEVSIGLTRLSRVGPLWDCASRVCGGWGGCAGGGVPLGAVPALSWCGEVSLGGIIIIITPRYYVFFHYSGGASWTESGGGGDGGTAAET